MVRTTRSMIMFLRRPRPSRPSSPTYFLIAIATLVFLPRSASAQVPTADIRTTCRIAAAAMVQLMSDYTHEKGLNDCLENENAAHAQIVKDWSTYSAADRAQCLHTRVYLPSYVEWLTCIEMERDARRLREARNEPAWDPLKVMVLPQSPTTPSRAPAQPRNRTSVVRQ